MKKLATIGAVLLMCLVMTTVSAEDKKPEMKKHCVTQKDAKTGKDREVCKMIRVHKKLDVKDDKK